MSLGLTQPELEEKAGTGLRFIRDLELSEFVRNRRKSLGLTQPELAEKAGTGLRFIRDLEQGKKTLQMDKVNKVLALFGYKLGPVRQERNG